MPAHPTAIIDPAACVDDNADIGPYCIVGAEVSIGARTRLMANLYIEGPTTIGEDNLFFPYSTVGVASQDKKYKGERAFTRIGSRNTIREFVTIHRGTEGGGLLTEIGDGNLLMAYTHVAHDVKIGNGAVLDNAVTLAGHVTVGDNATISAFSGVHQFCRVGRECFIGGYSVVTQDVMPFSSVVSEREIRVFGANRVGLERRDFSREAIERLQTAFRLLTRAGLNTSQAIERIRAEVESGPEIEELLAFIASSQRGVIKG
jgi:UDP-N-acetylglucosamine acyltransferase